MNARIATLREHAMTHLPQADSCAKELREESMSQTEGQPAVIREAKAIAHYYRNRPLFIWDQELIVGDRPRSYVGPVKMSIFGRRSWTGQNMVPIDDEAEVLFREGVLSWAGNHKTLDYDMVFDIGFRGLCRQIDERLARLAQDEPDGEQKRDFLIALKIVAEAYIDFSRRYSERALELSRQESDPERKLELETIAANCLRVPEHPPTSFWEACQCVWFSFFFVPDAPGRVDQYLYPFYRRDMERSATTREFAKELIRCLWIKYFEFFGPQGGVSAFNHLTLGGTTSDGRDASNEVTELCLEVTAELKLHRPQVALRWNRNMPTEIVEKAVGVMRSRTGNPDFCNDEQIVPALTHVGVSLEDARNFSLSGCHEVIVTGMSQMGSVEGFINMPKIVRIALGLEPTFGNGEMLSGIDSYDAFWEHITHIMDSIAEMAHRASQCRDQHAADHPGGHLETSLVTRDCIENGIGYTQGGARYNFCNWDAVGITNLADSLVAIRKLVFEEKTLSLKQLADALAADWVGHEQLRMEILNQLPHFGNNNDEVDEVAGQIIQTFDQILKHRTPYRGGKYILGTLAGGENMHIEFGRITGATPDGRKSGSSLADSIGPSQGRDRKGVTAMLNSVASLPHRLLPTATTLNVKLDPKLLENEDGIGKVASLIQGHFMSGGQQLQFNFYTREMLLEAQRHPEEYEDLMVRVAGYSAPFVSLWADMQEEILQRTEHEL